MFSEPPFSSSRRPLRPALSLHQPASPDSAQISPPSPRVSAWDAAFFLPGSSAPIRDSEGISIQDAKQGARIRHPRFAEGSLRRGFQSDRSRDSAFPGRDGTTARDEREACQASRKLPSTTPALETFTLTAAGLV